MSNPSTVILPRRDTTITPARVLEGEHQLQATVTETPQGQNGAPPVAPPNGGAPAPPPNAAQ
ncbi:hypothetical protein BGX21_005765, partial [Mortierella sp. AD011]